MWYYIIVAEEFWLKMNKCRNMFWSSAHLITKIYTMFNFSPQSCIGSLNLQISSACFMSAAVMATSGSCMNLLRRNPTFQPLHPLHPALHPPLRPLGLDTHSFLNQQSSILHEQIFNLPYFNIIQPNHTYRPQHTPGSLSGFSSPASSSCSSSSPNKDAFMHTQMIEDPKRTYSFTQEDLFTVLYGYSKGHQQGVGHAISGLLLPNDPGIRIYHLFKMTTTMMMIMIIVGVDDLSQFKWLLPYC